MTTRPLADLDPQLGPVLAHTIGNAHQVAMAVTTRALTLGVQPGHLRVWLHSRAATPELKALTGDAASYRPVIQAVTRYRSSLSSPPAARLAASRRLVGQIISLPRQPLSPRLAGSARMATAIVGSKLLVAAEGGFTTTLVPASWLAVRLGSEDRAAGVRALRAAETAGWLRQVQSRPGSAGTYKLPRLNREQSDRLWDASGAVQALADDDPANDFLAELVSTAGHPAWHWADGVLDARCWMTALGWTMDLLGLEGDTSLSWVQQVGVGVRAEGGKNGTAARLADAGIMIGAGGLAELLDEVAARTGAAARMTEAEEQRLVAAAERADQLQQVRELRVRVREPLEKCLLEATPCGKRGGTPTRLRVPDPSASQEVKGAWWVRLKAAVDKADLAADAVALAELRALLVQRLVRQGWERPKVRAVVERLWPEAGDSAA